MEAHTSLIDDEPPIDEVALTQLLRFNAVLTGVVFGLLAGITLFLATLLLVIKGGDVVGPHLTLLNQFLIGYEVTIKGSLIGLGYGFVGGFIFAYGIATIYNLLVTFRNDRRGARA